jgi:hypothetical protein
MFFVQQKCRILWQLLGPDLHGVHSDNRHGLRRGKSIPLMLPPILLSNSQLQAGRTGATGPIWSPWSWTRFPTVIRPASSEGSSKI